VSSVPGNVIGIGLSEVTLFLGSCHLRAHNIFEIGYLIGRENLVFIPRHLNAAGVGVGREEMDRAEPMRLFEMKG